MIHINTPAIATDILALLIRIIVGVSFIVAARNKNKNIKKFAKSNGLPVPMAYVVMAVEYLCGGAILIGWYAQFAALGLILLMLGTIRLHVFVWKSPYWAAKGGWEYDLMLLSLAAVVLVYGPGLYSLTR